MRPDRWVVVFGGGPAGGHEVSTSQVRTHAGECNWDRPKARGEPVGHMPAWRQVQKIAGSRERDRDRKRGAIFRLDEVAGSPRDELT